MLKIISQDSGGIRLALICDYCRKEITDPYFALFAWRVNKKARREISDGEIYFLHKGVCDEVTTSADDNHRKSLYDWQWKELTRLPAEIIQSLGITWEQARGELDDISVKDIVKSRLLNKEVDEWEKSAEPEEVEDDDEE